MPGQSAQARAPRASPARHPPAMDEPMDGGDGDGGGAVCVACLSSISAADGVLTCLHTARCIVG